MMELPSTPVALFFFSFMLAAGAVMSPGPVSAAVVSQSPHRGWIVGPLISSGHALLESILLLLIIIGLSPFLQQPFIKITISFVGGLLLIWMGLNFAIGAILGRLLLPQKDELLTKISLAKLFSLGIITTISNPFWYAWWATVAAGYLVLAKQMGVLFILAFYLGHISADFCWNTFLSTAFGKTGKWITQQVYNFIMAGCGLFLITIGGSFLFQVL